jgi:hypothetical protein
MLEMTFEFFNKFRSMPMPSNSYCSSFIFQKSLSMSTFQCNMLIRTNSMENSHRWKWIARQIDQFHSQVLLSSADSHFCSSIWRRLRHWIILDSDDDSTFRDDFRAFDSSSSSPWSSILSFLTSKCGGNIHELDVVNITKSFDSVNKRYHVANHSWTGIWYTKILQNRVFNLISRNHWFVWLLTHWNRTISRNNWFSWQLKAQIMGMCGNASTAITHRIWMTNISRRCSNVPRSSSPILAHPRPSFHFCQYIRLTQTGKNEFRCNYLELCNIEFFGRLRSQKPCKSLTLPNIWLFYFDFQLEISRGWKVRRWATFCIISKNRETGIRRLYHIYTYDF